jgi:hypothetical protein
MVVADEAQNISFDDGSCRDGRTKNDHSGRRPRPMLPHPDCASESRDRLEKEVMRFFQAHARTGR